MKNKTMDNQAIRWDFIRKWLESNFSADVCDENFHSAYHREFPAFRKSDKNWGAEPVAQAQRDLVDMYKCGILDRSRIGLGINWQPGFPKSVISYTLRNKK